MATIVSEAKRVKVGQSLASLNTTAMNAINQIKATRINLDNLKTEITEDSDYTDEDILAVQDVIDSINTEINNI